MAKKTQRKPTEKRVAKEMTMRGTSFDTHGGDSQMREERELEAYLAGALFQRRLVDFADSLEGADRVLFRDRLLTAKPVPYAAIARTLRTTPARAQKLSRALEARMREALRGLN